MTAAEIAALRALEHDSPMVPDGAGEKWLPVPLSKWRALLDAAEEALRLRAELDAIGPIPYPDDIDDVLAERDRLAAALEKYGWHARDCRIYEWTLRTGKTTAPPCDCGFDAALKGTP